MNGSRLVCMVLDRQLLDVFSSSSSSPRTIRGITRRRAAVGPRNQWHSRPRYNISICTTHRWTTSDLTDIQQHWIVNPSAILAEFGRTQLSREIFPREPENSSGNFNNPLTILLPCIGVGTIIIICYIRICTCTFCYINTYITILVYTYSGTTYHGPYCCVNINSRAPCMNWLVLLMLRSMWDSRSVSVL